MKLRLFGCAAAYVLAGTLLAAAQETPKSEMRESKEGQSSGAAQRDSNDSSAPGRSESAKGQRNESDSPKGDRAEGQGSSKSKEVRDSSPARQKESQSDKAAAGSDADKSKASPRTAAEKDSPKGDTSEKRANDENRAGRTDQRPDSAAKEEPASKDGAKQDQATDRSSAPSKGKEVQLSSEKRDRVQTSLRSDLKLKRETKVDVDISIGSRAPRHWAFAPVPATVIEIVPEYRGYVVAYVEDEYVICDPDTYEIVAVLPASGGDSLATTGRSTGEGGSDQCSTSLSLTQSEEKIILSEVQMDKEVDAAGVTIGWSVPSDIELQTFPNSVLDQSGKLSGCRYFIVDDQVAIVDPDQDRVVLLIENESR
jgi:hypothetical protein